MGVLCLQQVVEAMDFFYRLGAYDVKRGETAKQFTSLTQIKSRGKKHLYSAQLEGRYLYRQEALEKQTSRP